MIRALASHRLIDFQPFGVRFRRIRGRQLRERSNAEPVAVFTDFWFSSVRQMIQPHRIFSVTSLMNRGKRWRTSCPIAVVDATEYCLARRGAADEGIVVCLEYVAAVTLLTCIMDFIAQKTTGRSGERPVDEVASLYGYAHRVQAEDGMCGRIAIQDGTRKNLLPCARFIDRNDWTSIDRYNPSKDARMRVAEWRESQVRKTNDPEYTK